MAPRPKPEADQPAVVEPDAAAEAAPVEEAPPLRVFRLRDELVDDAGEPVARITFGCAPRVSVGAGETFSTSDLKLAARLASDPDFEETNA